MLSSEMKPTVGRSGIVRDDIINSCGLDDNVGLSVLVRRRESEEGKKARELPFYFGLPHMYIDQGLKVDDVSPLFSSLFSDMLLVHYHISARLLAIVDLRWQIQPP